MPYTAQVLHAAPAEVQTGLRRAMPALDYAVLLETGQAHGAFREELDRYDWLAAGGAHKVHRLTTATPRGAPVRRGYLVFWATTSRMPWSPLPSRATSPIRVSLI